MGLIVDIFEARSDNYGYLVHDEASGRTAAIDAPDATPILKALAGRGWTLSDVFITHHHVDHVEGIPGLKEAFPDLAVTGPRAEADKIGLLDVQVAGGDTVTLGETAFEIFDTPGHTLGHIAFYDRTGGHLFTADALFSMGVGRMFEGTPGPMWAALKILRALPDETLIYCGHEYTASNAKFALHVDPHNAALKARAAEVTALREKGGFTIPVSLGMEKATNPFLRVDRPEIAAAVGVSGGDETAVFAALRKAKDSF